MELMTRSILLQTIMTTKLSDDLKSIGLVGNGDPL